MEPVIGLLIGFTIGYMGGVKSECEGKERDKEQIKHCCAVEEERHEADMEKGQNND